MVLLLGRMIEFEKGGNLLIPSSLASATSQTFVSLPLGLDILHNRINQYLPISLAEML